MSQQSAVGDGPDHSPEAAEPPANQIRRSSRIQGRVLARQQSTLNSAESRGGSTRRQHSKAHRTCSSDSDEGSGMDAARRAHRDSGAQGENKRRDGELSDDPATADGPAANHRAQPRRARSSKKRRRTKKTGRKSRSRRHRSKRRSSSSSSGSSPISHSSATSADRSSGSDSMSDLDGSSSCVSDTSHARRKHRRRRRNKRLGRKKRKRRRRHSVAQVIVGCACGGSVCR